MSVSPSRTFLHNVRDYGARADGLQLDTEAINQAIAAASDAGGGVVYFPAGEYLSYTLRLRSRVGLKFERGATLIAADPPREGEPGGYDAPEAAHPNYFQDFGHSRFRNSLIWGENLDGVTIEGPGLIYGRGLSRGNGRIALPVGETAPQPDNRLPDVLEADGEVPTCAETAGHKPGAFGYPNPRDSLPAGVGNKTIALLHCRNVVVQNLTILHGGHFAILASGCEHVVLDQLLIDTNRDGIDIDGCNNVRVTRCSVNSPWDDGICIKSSSGPGRAIPAENITVSDCYVSGFKEGTLIDGTRSRDVPHRGGPIGRIKLGTESTGGYRNIAIANCVFEHCRGLALEQVDGSFMEDIVVSNLVMREVMNAPIFVRLAARLRGSSTGLAGSAQRISINNVSAYDVAPEHGIFIAGLETSPVRNIHLSNIQLYSRGGGTATDTKREVPEMPVDYPEPLLFGRLPAWGLYIRHAENLTVRDLYLSLLSSDERPAVWLENVGSVELRSVRDPSGAADSSSWVQRRCRATMISS